jgi:glycosyltransferase involved in cell wall biosynthesis
MKILRVITTMDPQSGGVVEAVQQSANSFSNSVNSMDILCFDDPNSPFLKESNTFVLYAIGKSKTGYGINLSYLNWLWANARSYDVVVLDGLWQFLSLGGYILKLLKVPFCVFTHGMLDPYFNNDKLKYIKKLPFWFCIERNIISLAAATIFTCKEESVLALNSFPFYKSTPMIATLGVEQNFINCNFVIKEFYKMFPELEGKRIILFLSRINKKKGIDTLINAVSKMSNIPDGFVIALAGPDNDGYRAKLEKQIETLELSDKFYWLNMLSGNAKWGAYHAAEAFILPSHQENFGIVVAEALSTSTPVLITNKVNIWQEIQGMSAGLVENDNIEGVKLLLENWLSLSCKDKKSMRNNAMKCFNKYFTVDAASTSLESIFCEVIYDSKRVI